MADAVRPPRVPTFQKFYQALHGRLPFPWQARLAKHVGEQESWPREVGVPTGLGKTSCLDIAIWWLASQADRCPHRRTAPTRIWWLVNRRILVDSTYDHAVKIRDALQDPAGLGVEGAAAKVLGAVADRLRSLSSDHRADPLEVIRLRGGVTSERPTDPSSPAVVLSTIPMYGSRLLFRGYGSGRLMRPVDAALAGTDSLLLIDEAHLARHLRSLLPSLADSASCTSSILNTARSQPQVVALTATGDAVGEERFDLDEEDERHPIVRKRLDARKPLEIREESGGAGLRLAEAATRLLRTEPHATASCLVFANTPDTARAVFDRLRTTFSNAKADIVLLTGRMREREARDIRERILDSSNGMAATRERTVARAKHFIVVATQTLEVGADIDGEYMVTEACGVRALTQRLGRLNRLGCFSNARGIYVHLPAPRRKGRRAKDGPRWPVYGREPETVLERLKNAADGQGVSVGPRDVARVLGDPGDDPGRAPEIVPGLLWEWVKTTTPPKDEAPVEPYFSGISGPDYRVSLIWRAHLPEEEERLWPRASDREAVEIPLSEVREVLGRGGKETQVKRLAFDGLTIEDIDLAQVRPGDTLVFPSDQGQYDEFGWNPRSTSAVVDMSLISHGLPLDAQAIGRLLAPRAQRALPREFRELIKMALGEVEDHDEIDKGEQREAVTRLRDVLLEQDAPEGWTSSEWDEAIRDLELEVVQTPKEVPRLPKAQTTSAQARSDELDERSLGPSATELDPHGRAVAARAESIGTRLGVEPELNDVVSRAGRWHDIGKADPRFQRWLKADPGFRPSADGDRLLAKSGTPPHLWEAMRRSSGWPAKGRHENLSARLARRWIASRNELEPSLADLLLHLIISHHGHGRPLVRPAVDGTEETLRGIIAGTQFEVSANLAVIDWDQPARFRRLNNSFGPWGLALLETILRQADHSVSAGARVAELEVSS